jgi:hypothetical protein
MSPTPGAGGGSRRSGGDADAWLHCAGDPPRIDSASLISELTALGVRTLMVTGDAPATAAIVARAVGLEGAVCPAGPIPEAVKPEDFAVFASILPEGRIRPRQSIPQRWEHGRDVPRRREQCAGAASDTDRSCPRRKQHRESACRRSRVDLRRFCQILAWGRY